MATTITGTTIDVGTNVIVTDSAGNVGIGISSPAEMLEIYNTSSPAIQLNDGGDYKSIMRLAGNDLEIRGSSGSLEFYNGAADGDSSDLAMKIDNAGIVTKPLQPAFLAYPTVAQQNIAASTSTIVLDAERFDQGGDFNTGTSTFTAPVTGKYQFNLNVRIGALLDTGAAYYRTYITTSNGDYNPTIIDPNFTADLNYYHLCFSVLVDMDAGDTAYAQVQQSGGTVQTDINADASQTNFSGYLVA